MFLLHSVHATVRTCKAIGAEALVFFKRMVYTDAIRFIAGFSFALVDVRFTVSSCGERCALTTVIPNEVNASATVVTRVD